MGRNRDSWGSSVRFTVPHEIKPYFAQRPLLSPRQLSVALHQLLRAVIRKTHGEPAVIVVAIHVDDGADPIGWMVNTLSDEGITVAFDARPRRGFRSYTRRALFRSRRTAAHASRELFR